MQETTGHSVGYPEQKKNPETNCPAFNFRSVIILHEVAFRIVFIQWKLVHNYCAKNLQNCPPWNVERVSFPRNQFP